MSRRPSASADSHSSGKPVQPLTFLSSAVLPAHFIEVARKQQSLASSASSQRLNELTAELESEYDVYQSRTSIDSAPAVLRGSHEDPLVVSSLTGSRSVLNLAAMTDAVSALVPPASQLRSRRSRGRLLPSDAHSTYPSLTDAVTVVPDGAGVGAEGRLSPLRTLVDAAPVVQQAPDATAAAVADVSIVIEVSPADPPASES